MAGAARGGAGSRRYCLPARPGAPPRAAFRAARPRRPECCESNVGLVPSGRRGQFLKGQPAGAQRRVLRRPPLGPGPDRRKTAGSGRSGRPTVRTPRREQRSPRVLGRLPVSRARPVTSDRRCGSLGHSRSTRFGGADPEPPGRAGAGAPWPGAARGYPAPARPPLCLAERCGGGEGATPSPCGRHFLCCCFCLTPSTWSRILALKVTAL